MAGTDGDTSEQIARVAFVRRWLGLFVYNMAAQEETPLRRREIETIVGGLSVAGRNLADVRRIDRLAAAWHRVFDDVDHGRFDVGSIGAFDLHGILGDGRGDAGRLRTDAIPGATEPAGLPAAMEEAAMGRAARQPDPLVRAAGLVLDFKAHRFFDSDNENVALLMMNGILLSAGEPCVTVPPALAGEFDKRMDVFAYHADRKAAEAWLGDFQVRTAPGPERDRPLRNDAGRTGR